MYKEWGKPRTSQKCQIDNEISVSQALQPRMELSCIYRLVDQASILLALRSAPPVMQTLAIPQPPVPATVGGRRKFGVFAHLSTA